MYSRVSQIEISCVKAADQSRLRYELKKTRANLCVSHGTFLADKTVLEADAHKKISGDLFQTSTHDRSSFAEANR